MDNRSVLGETIFSTTFNSTNDIDKALQNQEVSKRVNENIQWFYRMNLDFFKNLFQIGELLESVRNENKGWRGNLLVIQVLSKYQTLIKDGDVAYEQCAAIVLSALKAHQTALELIQKDQVPLALELLDHYTFKKISEIYDELLSLSESLCHLVSGSLREAEEDKIKSDENVIKFKKNLDPVNSKSETQALFNGIHDSAAQKAASLQRAIQNLGKIKTIFENIRVYWKKISFHCDHYDECATLIQKYKNHQPSSDLKDLLIKEIEFARLKWLSLGKINLVSSVAIRNANEANDRIMNNLEDEKEITIQKKNSLKNGL